MVGAYFTLSLGGHIVADTLMKPIELAVPAGEVGQGPAKQTNQTVQRKIVGPLSPHAIRRISIAKPKPTAKPDIDTELAEIRRAWRIYPYIEPPLILLPPDGVTLLKLSCDCPERSGRTSRGKKTFPSKVRAHPKV
jgi:hypothetical protein